MAAEIGFDAVNSEEATSHLGGDAQTEVLAMMLNRVKHIRQDDAQGVFC